MIRCLGRIGAVAGAAVLLIVLCAQAASAHPLGNFTVNWYDGLVVAPHELRVDHVEDLAEIPAAQAKPRIDTDGSGSTSAAELAAWARDVCGGAARGTSVRVDGKALRTTVARAAARPRPGQAGLPTLRVECRLTAELPALRGPSTLAFRSSASGKDAPGPGWREITARGDRTTLAGSDVPEKSRTHRLTRYPQELLSSPLDQRTAELRVRPGGPALGAAAGDDGASSVTQVLPRGVDRFTEAFTGLVARHRLTPGFALLALGAALVLGGMHALAPGHGKTIMAAYAAGRGRHSLRDVLGLGVTVTVTHTLGVLVLGLVVVAGSTVAPTALPWLGVASGALVAVAGVTLLRRALVHRGSDHGHTHNHAHTHAHGHGPGEHSHDHHRPKGSPILMGFAGGLVPSPSAIVVLIGAGALGQAWFGVLLVVAYGAGLALALVATGLLVVHAGDRLARAASASRGRLAGRAWRALHKTAPVGTAAIVLALGCTLALRGVAGALG